MTSQISYFFRLAPVLVAFVGVAGAAEFAWQRDYAKVLPSGDLVYTPEPFEFVAGESQRYIDFENGDDSASGSRAAPWKHHPWDADARGASKDAADETHTYVFKGGVMYRGQLNLPGSAPGTEANPVRLTRDPSWGEGAAILAGSERVVNWSRNTHPDMPSDQPVWMAEVDFLPRTLWLTDGGERIIRMKLARWPNWQESDPNDLMSEWPTWEQPEWWKGKNKIKVEGQDRHLGIDKDLPKPLGDLEGGVVWTEWGIVMGSPYPARIEAVDERQSGVAFRGPWTYGISEHIITGNRYHLENLPQFLDEPGEFWVEKTGNRSAKIFARFPKDVDPNRFHVEAGRHLDFLKGERFGHLHISGLTFRFMNVGWHYYDPQWAHGGMKTGVINIRGGGESIVVHHNLFQHVNMPVHIKVGGLDQRIGSVAVRDNRIEDTDFGAIHIENETKAGDKRGLGALDHVEVLRNKLERVGMRNLSGAHGHAISVTFATTAHLAGNFLNRIAGWGVSVFGGKGSGTGEIEVPLTRTIIHQNRVEDVLLKSNDWGGIETWQGGSHYVFNNIVINAVGFKNWTFREGDPNNMGSFGHAYYMDGSFKNYLFNNIGLGRNNTLGTKGVNATAIQNIISFENWYFNNSFHRFAETTRQQAPSAGRFRYLGNIFSDTSKMLFRHTKPEDVEPDPNAAHFTQGGDYAYHTMAYSDNVLHKIDGKVGAFEETGVTYEDMSSFSESLAKVKAQVSSVGVTASSAPLVDPDRMDWRPTSGSAARNHGVIVFVPWGTARTVGEWQFTLNRADPAAVIDEHWFMTADYVGRDKYKDTPRFPLVGENIAAGDFMKGPIANWTESALKLNGRDQYLVVTNASLPAADRKGSKDAPAAGNGSVEAAIPFGKVTHPAKVTPGSEFPVTVELTGDHPGQQVDIHLHWMKSNAWGGFSNLGGKPVKIGDNRYRFTIKAGVHNGLASYNLLVYLSPDGSFVKKTANATVNMKAGEGVRVAGAQPRSVDVDDTGFMAEVHLKTSDTDGVVVSKMANGKGYQLVLEGGLPRFSVADDAGTKVAVSAETPVNNGQWRHILAELDRSNGKLNLYIDGQLSASQPAAQVKGSLSNPGDFLVGGGPGQDYLEGSFDFLRVSLSTLAESKTTIEELHSWQFDGPQYYDFTGNNRRKQNAAGALLK